MVLTSGTPRDGNKVQTGADGGTNLTLEKWSLQEGDAFSEYFWGKRDEYRSKLRHQWHQQLSIYRGAFLASFGPCFLAVPTLDLIGT